MYYVYLLENQIDKSWYTGYSADLKQRISDHQNGKGGKTTKQKPHWTLIYYEAYKHKSDAQGGELFLKSGSGKKYLKKQLAHYLENVL